MIQTKEPVAGLPCPHYDSGCLCTACMKAQRHWAEQTQKFDPPVRAPVDARG
jgi:hypothetical protein